ncbi:MAG: 30S ribosomal protein S20 [Myxococcota bacterium]
MAHHKSALKRVRQDAKRRARNREVLGRMRTHVKQFRAALESGDPAAAEKLRSAESVIRRAASKGVIPSRRASRHVARLTRALNAASAQAE